MALIKCERCGKMFSDRAKQCPDCGCTKEEGKQIALEKQRQAEEARIRAEQQAEEARVQAEKEYAERVAKIEECWQNNKKKVYLVLAIVIGVIGGIKLFNAIVVNLPMITTSAATNISYTSATVGGNVTEDGCANVTERGVVLHRSPNATISDSRITSGSGTGSFTYNLSNLKAGTTYYVRAYAINKKGVAYGEQVSFVTKKNPPSNLIAKAFSVSSTKQVYFSKGNLQYHPSNNKWRFAESQLDYIGWSNSNCSSIYDGWLDLFAWSTGTTNFGVSTSTDNDYSGSFVDWGTNKIGNDAPNTWRTLTYYEWKYLLNNRANANNLKGFAEVNGVNGLILLPDNWTCPSGVTFKSGFHSDMVDYFEAYQTFTADQWSKLEAAGAVFLPIAGYRYDSCVDGVQYDGYYWSATESNSNYAYYLSFRSDGAGAYMGDFNRSRGQSVRLVKDL